MEGGEQTTRIKGKESVRHHSNNLDSQNFQIILVNHLSLMFKNPPAISVIVSGKFVCQKK